MSSFDSSKLKDLKGKSTTEMLASRWYAPGEEAGEAEKSNLTSDAATTTERRPSLFSSVIVEDTFSKTAPRRQSSSVTEAPVELLEGLSNLPPGSPFDMRRQPSSMTVASRPTSIKINKPVKQESSVGVGIASDALTVKPAPPVAPLPTSPIDLEVRYFYIPFVSEVRCNAAFAKSTIFLFF